MNKVIDAPCLRIDKNVFREGLDYTTGGYIVVRNGALSNDCMTNPSCPILPPWAQSYLAARFQIIQFVQSQLKEASSTDGKLRLSETVKFA